MFGRKKRPMLTRGQIREDWNWPLDWAVNLGKVKCSFDRVVNANLEENGFKKWCKRPVRSRVYTVVKDFAVMTTTELHSLWGEKWNQETSFPDAADDCLPLRSEEQSSRERKTYDAVDGGGADLNHICISYCCCYNKWPKPLWMETKKCIILYFWRSEIQNLVTWAKTEVSADVPSFLQVVGENLFSCLFQLLKTRSCVVGRGYLLKPEHSLCNTLFSLCPASFVLQGQTCLLLLVSLDFLLLLHSPLWWKGHLLFIFFGVGSRRSYRSLQNHSTSASLEFEVGA